MLLRVHAVLSASLQIVELALTIPLSVQDADVVNLQDMHEQDMITCPTQHIGGYLSDHLNMHAAPAGIVLLSHAQSDSPWAASSACWENFIFHTQGLSTQIR